MSELQKLQELLNGRLTPPPALAAMAAGQPVDPAAALAVSEFIETLQGVVTAAQDSADRAYMAAALP